MASVYRPTGRKIYRIEFKDQHGKPRTASSGSRDKRIAESLASKIEEDADRLRAGMPPLHEGITGVYLGLRASGAGLARTWVVFVERYEAEELGGQREKSRRKALDVLKAFKEECQPRCVQDVDERMVSQFAAKLRERPIRRGKKIVKYGLEPWSIKNYLGALHAALIWAERQKLIREVPTFPNVIVPKLRPQPIREDAWRKLVKEAPNELWRAYLLCGWYGGLRLNEAYQLRRSPSEEWPWLDLAGDRIVLPARFVKAGVDQWIPLHPELRAALAALPISGDEIFPFKSRLGGGQRRLSNAGVSQFVRLLAKRAGVKLSMHSLRKGFGCRVAAQLGKGNAPILHRLMRHSSMQITMDFYASVDDVLHESISQLDRPSANPVQLPTAHPTAAENRQPVLAS